MKCNVCREGGYQVQIVKLVNQSFAALCVGHRQRHAAMIAEHQPSGYYLATVAQIGTLAELGVTPPADRLHPNARDALADLVNTATRIAQVARRLTPPLPGLSLDGVFVDEVSAAGDEETEAAYASLTTDAPDQVLGPDSFGGSDYPDATPTAVDEPATVPVPVETNRETVYGAIPGMDAYAPGAPDCHKDDPGYPCGKCFSCNCPF